MMSKFTESTGIHISAAVLLILTLLSIGLSQYYSVTWWLTVTLVLLTIVKGQQITDVFMELKYAPRNWRFFLLAYAVIIPIVLGAILYL